MFVCDHQQEQAMKPQISIYVALPQVKFFMSIAMLSLCIASCNSKPTVEEEMKMASTICYRAIDKTDTGWLKIDTSTYQKLGTLDFNYPGEKRLYEGQFKGTMNGDTLKGHYDFKVNKVDKWYRNPVAMLNRDGKLIMGVGAFAMIWGSGFFDEKTPIDYDKGRFVFERIGCEIR